jgi:hypothetical protein
MVSQGPTAPTLSEPISRLHRAQQLDCFLFVPEQTVRDGQQLLAHLSKLDDPPTSVEQFHAETIFERLNMRRHGGLTYIQDPRSGSEPAGSGNGMEGGEPALIH